MERKFVRESQLAKTLGVNRPIITAIRIKNLVRRKDWKVDKHRGRKILITQSGLQKICAELKVEIPSFEGGDEPCATLLVKVPQQDTTIQSQESGSSSPESVQSVFGANGSILLQVHRLYQNPYMLEAKSEAGQIFRVQVRSNLKYTIGDKLKAVAEHLGAPILRQIGASPRWKGDKAYVNWL